MPKELAPKTMLAFYLHRVPVRREECRFRSKREALMKRVILQIPGLTIRSIITLAPAIRSWFGNGFEFIYNSSCPASVHPLEHGWASIDLNPSATRTLIAALFPPWL
jgi:hypothetical protein